MLSLKGTLQVRDQVSGALLSAWGTAGPGDLNGDGTVSGADLGAMLARW